MTAPPPPSPPQANQGLLSILTGGGQPTGTANV